MSGSGSILYQKIAMGYLIKMCNGNLGPLYTPLIIKQEHFDSGLTKNAMARY